MNENMMANENLHEPCRVSGVGNENERWTMCIFFCVRGSLNETQKQKESDVLEGEISIVTAISSMSRICLVLNVLEAWENESSCVLCPSCEMESGNGLNNLSSSNSWTHYYFCWQL